MCVYTDVYTDVTGMQVSVSYIFTFLVKKINLSPNKTKVEKCVINFLNLLYQRTNSSMKTARLTFKTQAVPQKCFSPDSKSQDNSISVFFAFESRAKTQLPLGLTLNRRHKNNLWCLS